MIWNVVEGLRNICHKIHVQFDMWYLYHNYILPAELLISRDSWESSTISKKIRIRWSVLFKNWNEKQWLLCGVRSNSQHACMVNSQIVNSHSYWQLHYSYIMYITYLLPVPVQCYHFPMFHLPAWKKISETIWKKERMLIYTIVKFPISV